jgi:putative ABC transport system permease protein
MILIDTETAEVREVQDRRRSSGGTFGAMGLLVRRRLWRERWLFINSAVIVALATLLAYAGPALVEGTIDRGASDAVVAAGHDADILVTYPVGNPAGDNVTTVRGLDMALFEESSSGITERLPGTTKSVVGGYTAWVESDSFVLMEVTSQEERDEAESEDRDPEAERRGGQYLTFGFATGAEVDLVAGELPAVPERIEPTSPLEVVEQPPVELAATTAFAETFELVPGDLILVTRASGESTRILISGIVEPVDPTAPAWQSLLWANEPLLVREGEPDEVARGTLVGSIEALEVLTTDLNYAFTANVNVTVDPSKITLENSRRIVRELNELPQNTEQLMRFTSVLPRIETGLPEALEQYPARARAAMSQMSVVIAGVVAVAAVVIALMAQLMLTRREGDISLERARGASVTSIGVRLLIESVIFAAVGFAVGLGVAYVLAPGLETSNGLANVIAITAITAGPVLGVLAARRTWTGRREAANRQDRAKVRKGKAARRLTLDALALLLAAVAIVTVRNRGVLQTQSEGVDSFLAAAPVLVALGVVVVVVRLYPIPMKVVQFFARRTRGVAGVISLAKARQSIPVLPLLSLTLAIAVAVSGGLLVATVRSGQDAASWQRVGADVRIEGEITELDVAHFEEQGLTVSTGIYQAIVTFALGSEYEDAAMVAMDENYPQILAQSGVTDTSEIEQLNALMAQRGPGDPVPVLASQEFIDLDVYGRSELFLGRTYIPVEIVGRATVTPDGWASGPFVVVPLQPLLDAETETPIAPNLTLVSGANAQEVVASRSSIPDESVETREAWLERVQDSALIGGVELAMVLAVAAVAVLAAIGLLVTVLRGVRERGRALSMLRTQGMGSGWGWWLSLAELAPVVLSAVVGGGVAGVLIVYLLGGSLGLEVLSGGTETPALDVNWYFMGAVGAGVLVLLFAAVAAEVAAHRRDRLSDVLRYGETR